MKRPVTLRDLLTALPQARVIGSLEGDVTSVVCDSRQVVPGSVFVAIRGGQQRDRHEFLGDAVARGARAIVVEDEMIRPECCTVVHVENARLALARLAAAFHGNPGAALRLVGVTGTNGKTTTAMVLQHIMQAGGIPCAYLGTLGVRVPHQAARKLSNTTPEPPELHAELRRMVEVGTQSAVLEVSSHGLALGRVSGLRFAAGVFTNLTRDHLDFHGTEQRYLDAKARLFEGLEAGAVAVINADDPVLPVLRERCRAAVITYGRSERADFRMAQVQPQGPGTAIHMESPHGSMSAFTPLLGSFNAYNVTAAVACGMSLGMSRESVLQGVAAMGRVPGRFEPIRCGQPFRVLVDYAHTPAGLENVLAAAREITPGRVLCVFGCGGDRDPGKRPIMGGVVEHQADRAFVTSDNPRSEEPMAIIAAILKGMKQASRAVVQPDRRAAISAALAEAVAGDTVVIAGKGHETGQIVGERVIPFDDAEVARNLLEARQVVEGHIS